MTILSANPLDTLLSNLYSTTRLVFTIIAEVAFYILLTFSVVHELGKVLKIIFPARSRVLESITTIDAKRKRTISCLWAFWLILQFCIIVGLGGYQGLGSFVTELAVLVVNVPILLVVRDTRRKFTVHGNTRLTTEYAARFGVVAVSLWYLGLSRPVFTVFLFVFFCGFVPQLVSRLIEIPATSFNRGKVVDGRFLLVRRALFTDAYCVLHAAATKQQLDFKSNDATLPKDEQLSPTIQQLRFFSQKFLVLAREARAAISFNIVVSGKKADMYFVLCAHRVIASLESVKARLEHVAEMLHFGLSGDVGCEARPVVGERIKAVLASTVRLDADQVIRWWWWRWWGWLTKKPDPEIVNGKPRDGAFFDGRQHGALLRLDLATHYSRHARTIFEARLYLDRTLKLLMEAGIEGNYAVHFKVHDSDRDDTTLPSPDDKGSPPFQKRKRPFQKQSFDQPPPQDPDEKTSINCLSLAASLLVVAPTEERLVESMQEARGILESNLGMVANPVHSWYKARRALGARHLDVVFTDMPCHAFYKLVHVPSFLATEEGKRFELDVEVPPDSTCGAGTIAIGQVLYNNMPYRDFKLRVEDLQRHAFINGATGSGKSSFVQNLLSELFTKYPKLPVMLIEMKSEYTWLQKRHPDVELLEPGINLGINLFEPSGNPKVHAERVYDIMQSSFDFSTARDFTPQMEKTLVDVILATCTEQDPAKRNFQQFFKNAQDYVRQHKDKIPYLDSTWIGIENRIRRIASGPLQRVFNNSLPHVNFGRIYGARAIISLRNIIALGGSKDDLFFVANMLFKYLWDANLTKGSARSVNHVTIVEDSQYFVKKRDTNAGTAGFSSYFEDLALLLRGTGEALVAIATRPAISPDIIANCGLVACFQTKLRDDIIRLQGPLHLSDKQAGLLEILPEHVALVRVNSYQYPFLLRSRTLFEAAKGSPAEVAFPGVQVAAGTVRPSPLMALKDLIARRFKPLDFLDNRWGAGIPLAVKHELLRLVNSYCVVDDHKWKSFQQMSMADIKEAEAKMAKILGEVNRLVTSNPGLARILKEARRIRPRIEALEKVSPLIAERLE